MSLSPVCTCNRHVTLLLLDRQEQDEFAPEAGQVGGPGPVAPQATEVYTGVENGQGEGEGGHQAQDQR